MAATIKDVARETRLAPSTISKYMNGGRVRRENQEIIEKAIRKLDYHPNSAARGLRAQKAFTIGLLTGGLDNQFFARLEWQIEQYLKERQYTLYVCCYHDKIERAERDMRFLIQKKVDGILMVTIHGAERCVKIAGENHIPIVLLDRGLKSLPVDYVMSNAAPGVYEAVEYLIRRGHEKIGMITGMNFHTSKDYRSGAEDGYRGFQRALADYDIALDEEYLIDGDFSFASGYRCMQELWKRERHPTALVIGNYNMCIGAVTAMHNLGIRVPEELSVITFDDLEFSKIVTPPLTAVGQQTDLMAREAVDLILRRIDGDYSDFPRKMKVRTLFTERESVATLYK